MIIEVIIGSISWLAAIDIEIPVRYNNDTICSVSFIAVLNLIIDNAPTNPKDKTKLLLIVTTIKKIETENGRKKKEKT
tara:strand:+ start:285 stop:518 length:234 start_codon:yes stop_codon:yes gene_type:complete